MGEIADYYVEQQMMGLRPVGTTTSRFNSSKENKSVKPKSEGSKMNIRVQQQQKQIEKGSIVMFPQYQTAYVVHSADQAAQEKYSMQYKGALQLYRLDGQKPYRKIPFTQDELLLLIENLNGEVYSRDKYDLELVPKV